MRYYNGCPDSELQALLNAQGSLLDAIKKLEPAACCTYFPMEERWQVHKWGEPLSGFYSNKLEALKEALRNVNEQQLGKQQGRG
jgi:hypothetical protein